MATENKAELTAPAFPIANVATGTPAGICAVENMAVLSNRPHHDARFVLSSLVTCNMEVCHI